MAKVAESFRPIVNAARDQGWKIDRTRTHLRLVPANPAMGPVFTPSTPSSVRAIHNVLAILKQRGLIYPPKSRKEERAMALPPAPVYPGLLTTNQTAERIGKTAGRVRQLAKEGR